jgi:NAD-dependent dihydropyrimidine dehydrogenase PreA subunit
MAGDVTIMAAETTVRTSAALTGEGWEKRATYDEPRLSELADMYKELGYEVYLQPFNPDEATGCAQCLKVSPEKYKTIYIRKAADRE